MDWDQVYEQWVLAAIVSIPITYVLLIPIGKQIEAGKKPSLWIKALACITASPILVPLLAVLLLIVIILLPFIGFQWMQESRYRPIRAIGKTLFFITILPIVLILPSLITASLLTVVLIMLTN